MAVSSLNPLEEFVCILRDTLNPNNHIRKNAEERMKSIDQDTKMNMLLQVMASDSPKEILEVASVLLRRTIDRSGGINKIPEKLAELLKSTLPKLCLSQSVPSIRNKFVYALASLASVCVDNQRVTSWPESTQFFYECLVRTNHDVGKDIALRLIDAAPCILAQFSNDILPNVLRVITDTLSLDTQVNKELVVLAAKAFSSILIDICIRGVQQHIENAMQIYLHVMSNTNNLEMLGVLLQELNVVVECRTKVVRNHTSTLLEIMLAILLNPEVPHDVRFEAMECVVTLAEHAPKTFKAKGENALPSLVNIFIQHITLIEDDPNWAFTVEDSGDKDENEVAVTAETSLDRLACAIGGKLMLPLILKEITPLLNSQTWQHRYAALVTLSCSAEGCFKQLKPMLPKVVELMLPFLKDPHPRVVYACINAIGQLSVDFVTHFHQTYHQQVFPGIFFAAANYGAYPRVQAHAVCCFVNLIDGCPAKILEHYAEYFFQHLEALFISSVNTLANPGVSQILENVLSSLSHLAEVLGPKFTPFYPRIAKNLITLAHNFVRGGHVKFYINSLDALSTILLSVGLNECQNELQAVLSILQSFDINSINSKDPNNNYLIQYLDIMANIASVIGENFTPLLSGFMPTLLSVVSTPTDNNLISCGMDAVDTFTSNQGGLKKMFSAHTDALVDKHRACLILMDLCYTLKSTLGDYVESILAAMLKNLTECNYQDVQYDACDIFPPLLECALPKGNQYVTQLWQQIFAAFHYCITTNDGFFRTGRIFQSIQGCLNVVKSSPMDYGIISQIVEMMNFEVARLIKEFGDKSGSESIGQSDDDNMEDYESASEEYFDDISETGILKSIHNLHHDLFTLYEDNFTPLFQSFLPSIVNLIECRNAGFQSYGIAMLADLVEVVPQVGVNYVNVFFPHIHRAILNPSPSVRQAAAQMVGAMVEFGANYYQAYVSQCVPSIIQSITEKVSPDDSSSSTYVSHAITTIGRIIKYCPSCVAPVDNAIKTWVGWLSVCDVQTNFSAEYLLELIETRFQVIAGPDNSDLPIALTAIAHMVVITQQDVTKKYLTMLSQLKAHVPGIFEAWYNGLSQVLKENLDYAEESVSSA